MSVLDDAIALCVKQGITPVKYTDDAPGYFQGAKPPSAKVVGVCEHFVALFTEYFYKSGGSGLITYNHGSDAKTVALLHKGYPYFDGDIGATKELSIGEFEYRGDRAAQGTTKVDWKAIGDARAAEIEDAEQVAYMARAAQDSVEKIKQNAALQIQLANERDANAQLQAEVASLKHALAQARAPPVEQRPPMEESRPNRSSGEFAALAQAYSAVAPKVNPLSNNPSPLANYASSSSGSGQIPFDAAAAKALLLTVPRFGPSLAATVDGTWMGMTSFRKLLMAYGDAQQNEITSFLGV